MSALRQEDMEYKVSTPVGPGKPYLVRVLVWGASSACVTVIFVLQRAVTALNGLQTNAQVLEQIRKAGSKVPFSEMPRMYQYLERTGLKVVENVGVIFAHV